MLVVRAVVIQVIPVFDVEKRHQMIRELRALYKNVGSLSECCVLFCVVWISVRVGLLWFVWLWQLHRMALMRPGVMNYTPWPQSRLPTV